MPTSPLPQSASMPSSNQFQQLISLLQSQLAANSPSPSPSPAHISAAPASSSSNPLQAPFTGTTLFSPFVAATSSPSSLWLLDTSATHHVCCDITCFTDSFPVSDAYVNLPNGTKASVSHMGTIHLTPTLTLQSVLCVPSFSFNLISISSLSSALSCLVSFSHDSIIIQGASPGTVIGRGSRLGNLYSLDISCNSSTVSSVPLDVSHVNSAVAIDIWHRRLGHLSFNKLKAMNNILSFSKNTHSLCEVCPLAKQHHLSFSESDSVASDVFDLVHCDIWGPFSPCTTQGYAYFLTIVDDKSRFVWTFLMKHKSDVKTILIQVNEYTSVEIGEWCGQQTKEE